MPTPKVISALLARMKELRERSGLSAAQLEERLILGPGWVERFESGAAVPSLDMLLGVLQLIGASPNDLFSGALPTSAGEIDRQIHAVDGKDLLIHFRYAAHDAVYRLPKAKLEEFEAIVKKLRDGLARLAFPGGVETRQAIKTDAVARAFLLAVKTWPRANPSDLWGFLISRAFCDPFNHPAEFARLDLGQSWKRTSGWALEEVLVRHYSPFLKTHGIDILIAPRRAEEGAAQAIQYQGPSRSRQGRRSLDRDERAEEEEKCASASSTSRPASLSGEQTTSRSAVL